MAVSQAPTNNYYQVTDEQLSACHRHETNGKVHYTVDSASEADVFYTIRWNPAYKLPQCNCAAGREGRSCWHQRAVMQAESVEQEAIASEARSAALREERAVKKYGTRAYEPTPFSLLKSA